MAKPLWEQMGARFGYDFSNIRIFADGEAARAADALSAAAMTVGHAGSSGWEGSLVAHVSRLPDPGVPQIQHKCAQCSGEESAMRRLLGDGRAWTKLAVGAPDDRYEREADQMSAMVMRMPEPAGDSRRPAATPTAPVLAGGIRALHGAGTPLQASDRSFFEARFGFDFSSVRVHDGPVAVSTAGALGARAYTIGHDVVFGGGQYMPRTSTGRHLLAHELTHVVQQTQGRPAAIQGQPAVEKTHTLQQAGAPGVQVVPRGVSHPGDPAEREAERAADAIAAGRPVGRVTAGPPVIARHKGGTGKYKTGALSKPTGWLYVAYLDEKKARLIFGHNVVGTFDWATKNPGSVDYDWPSANNPPGAAAKAGANRSYEKNASDPSGNRDQRLLKRLAIFPSEEEGRAAIFDILKVHGAKDPNRPLEDVLFDYKGMEPSGIDVKIVLDGKLRKEFPDEAARKKEVDKRFSAMSPEDKRRMVKEHYLGLVRAGLKRQKMSDADINTLLKKAFKDITPGSKEYEGAIDAVTHAESTAHPPGVDFECAKGLSRTVATVSTKPGGTVTRVARTPQQEKIILDLFKEKASVEAELNRILDCDNPAASPATP